MFLMTKDIYQDDIRLALDSIESYKAVSHYMELRTKSGNVINLPLSPEELDQILNESYLMVKRV